MFLVSKPSFLEGLRLTRDRLREETRNQSHNSDDDQLQRALEESRREYEEDRQLKIGELYDGVSLSATYKHYFSVEIVQWTSCYITTRIPFWTARLLSALCIEV